MPHHMGRHTATRPRLSDGHAGYPSPHDDDPDLERTAARPRGATCSAAPAWPRGGALPGARIPRDPVPRGEVGSHQVNQAGAFETVAEQPFGKFLLVALDAGLAAMTLWRLVQTFVGVHVRATKPRTAPSTS